MNSVLLVGNISFTTSVIAQVRGLDALSVTTVATAQEALHFMNEMAPDVAIAQASQLIQGSILKTFRQRRHSIYFVVIEESTPEAALPTTDISELPFLEQYLEKTAGAIESGADGYLWLPSHRPPTVLIETVQKAQVLSVSLSQTPSQDHDSTSAQASGQISDQISVCPSPRVFRQSQRRLIQAHIQMGLSRAQRYRDLSRINDWLSAVALVDALTQLGNRRAFDVELPNQIEIARRQGTPLSIMVLDIDFFKSVNDRYGHLIGDDVLRMISQRLLANMRFYDKPFRYGGEEFVITLSSTDLTEGSAIAERLRQSIAQKPFEINHGIDTSDPLLLTVSIGLSQLRPEDDQQGRSFLHRADQNLLQAKAAGRNRVISQGD